MQPQLRALLENISPQSTGSRNSALAPLLWMLPTACAFVVALVEFHAPPWLLVVATTATMAIICVALFWFCVFAKKSPEALRSEKYVLSRMAMDRGLLGDDKAGLHDPRTIVTEGTSLPLLVDPGSPTKGTAGEK